MAIRMEPRIYRRRVEVRRQEGRHRLRVLVTISTVVVTACAGWGLTRSPLLDLDRIEVVGASHVTAQQVRAASGLGLGEALTDVDGARAARAIGALPWVQRAVVARHWPSRVTIRITERSAVAAAAAGLDRFALVDKSGQVLEVVDRLPPGGIQLAGLPPAGPPGSRLDEAGVATL